MAIDATQWQSAQWAKEKGLYAEVHDGIEEMDNAIDILAKKLSKSNPEAMKDLKKIWRYMFLTRLPKNLALWTSAFL